MSEDTTEETTGTPVEENVETTGTPVEEVAGTDSGTETATPEVEAVETTDGEDE